MWRGLGVSSDIVFEFIVLFEEEVFLSLEELYWYFRKMFFLGKK